MYWKYISIGSIAVLAACGGSGGGEDGDGDGNGILSTGILTEVEVPSSADLAGLPSDVQDLVNDFVTANETLTATSSRPPGTADYEGAYGFGFDDADNATVVVGDMGMSVNFDTGLLSGTVSNLIGDDEGTTLVIGNDLAVLGVIDNTAEIAGTVSGDVELEGETYNLEASIAGSFGGATAETALGTTMGLVTNPDDSTDSISGYFLLDQQ